MRSSTQLLKESCSLFIQNSKLFIIIGIFPAIFGLIVSPLFTEQKTGEEIHFTPTLIIVAVLGAVISMLMYIAYAKAVSAPATAREAYIFAKEHFFSYTWVTILTGIILVIGFILLIIPGFIFMFWYMFATYTVLFEGKKGMDALRSSKELVKGKFGAVAGRFAFLFIISLVVLVPLGLIVSTGFKSQSKIVTDILGAVINLITYPIFTAYMYFMYQDLKKEKETVAQSNVSANNPITATVSPIATTNTPDQSHG